MSLLPARAPLGPALALVLSAAIQPATVAAPPNVILIMTDDQGYGDLSVHGNPVLRTPNLDRLHAGSIRFTDFHAAPMCTPTRGQLLTGIDALRNGAMNVSSGRTLLRREFPTMAEVFKAGGYRTGMFGKWHLGDNYPYRPEDRGFDETIWLPSSHTPSAADHWNNDYFDDVYRHNGAREPFSGYCTDVFFRESIAWMRRRAEAKEPFLCYLALNAPHGPLFVPDRYREPYRGRKPAVASFFAMISNIDENMGRLEAFLQESGLRDDTVLIFLTDNGTATGESVFNAGMRGKKIHLHEGGHRVPFFIRWPAGNLRASGDIDELAECQDVLPTLIDLCGLEAPRGAAFDGTSLADLLRGKAAALPDRMLVVQFSRMQGPRPRKGDAAVLWKKWRLVGMEELHDVASDPGQERNVISLHPEVARRMREHYDRWWAAVAPRADTSSPIHVGSDREPLTFLTPCDWKDVFLDQAAQVRRGEAKNGAWHLLVERAGEYEISLRRWPFEADLAITAAAPEYRAADGRYPEGKALPVATARIRIAGAERTLPVAKNDKAATFRLPLDRGPASLQTWLLDAEGKELCGAYFAYVRRVGG